jgi:hypothetical protein
MHQENKYPTPEDMLPFVEIKGESISKKGCGCNTKKQLKDARSLLAVAGKRINALEIEREAMLLFIEDNSAGEDWISSKSMYIEHVKGEEG